MSLKNIIDLIPIGMIDHIRVYSGNNKIDKFYNFFDCKVITLSPGLKQQHCGVISIYDAYLDIFIDASDEMSF